MHNRRDFLRTLSATTLATLGASAPRLLADEAAVEKIAPTADRLIILWMGGGMAHTETFDPKRYAPFERGMDPNSVLSTFPSIDTAVDHIKFSAGLEKMGSVMDRGTFIRRSMFNHCKGYCQRPRLAQSTDTYNAVQKSMAT